MLSPALVTSAVILLIMFTPLWSLIWSKVLRMHTLRDIHSSWTTTLASYRLCCIILYSIILYILLIQFNTCTALPRLYNQYVASLFTTNPDKNWVSLHANIVHIHTYTRTYVRPWQLIGRHRVSIVHHRVRLTRPEFRLVS